MLLEQNVLDIINIATEKGLKNVEIRIIGNVPLGINEKDERGTVVLWSNGKDRFSCNSLAELKAALESHKDLKWMN